MPLSGVKLWDAADWKRVQRLLLKQSSRKPGVS
jgi:hypothetical protein